MLKGFGKVFDDIKKSVKDVVAPTQCKEEMAWDLEGEGVTLVKAHTQSGSLDLHGGELTTVNVQAEKVVKAPTQEEADAFAQQVEVIAECEGDTVVLDAQYPDPPDGVDVSVSFKITAPLSVNSKFATGSGSIQVTDVEGEVTLEAGSGGLKLRNCQNTMNLQTGSGEIAIAECNGHVYADAGSGGIKVQQHIGNALLHTASGSIRVTDIEGCLDAKSDSGHITLRNSVGTVDLTALSGRISADLQNVIDHANFKTSSGSINIKLMEGAAPLFARSNSGGISVSLPVEFAGELDARTASGSIRCQFPIFAEEKVQGHLKGRIGEGEGMVLDLETSSGSIQVTARGKFETKV